MIKACISVIIVFLLAACSSDGSGRYKNNADLERPPEVPATQKADQAEIAGEAEAPQPRRRGMGLKSDIYKPEDSTALFKIKRSFDEAWLLLHQAIQHNDLKIADQDRSKGVYYVNYDGHSLLSLTGSLFSNKDDQPSYLIKVEGQGAETDVTISLAKKEEQAVSSQSNDDQTDKSEQLLDLLFDTLQDHIKSD